MKPKVTILHVRDPDSACDVRVFIDGVEQDWQDIGIVDVDAGRGYTLEDWNESRAWAKKMPESALRDAVIEAYGDPPGAKYIDDWSDREQLDGTQ